MTAGSGNLEVHHATVELWDAKCHRPVARRVGRSNRRRGARQVVSRNLRPVESPVESPSHHPDVYQDERSIRRPVACLVVEWVDWRVVELAG